MTKGVEIRPRTDVPPPARPPVFKPGDWVRLIWLGHNTTGQVTQAGLLGGFRFVSFTEVDSGVQYTVPPELLERVLSPRLEDVAKIILGEDLMPRQDLGDFTIEDARNIVTKIAHAVRAEEEEQRAGNTRDADAATD